MNRRGGILILFIFGISGFFLALIGGLDFINVLARRQRAQDRCDSMVLSTMRLRAKALETLASRWQVLGAFISSADMEGVVVDRSHWSALIQTADQLVNSLPGYQSRMRSIGTVLAQAYQTSADTWVATDVSAMRIGLIPQTFMMREPLGDKKTVTGGWYQRTWGRIEQDLFVMEHQGVRAQAHLVWEADEGNGGFPSIWSSALVGNQLQPHRYPFYRAELVAEP